MPTVHVRVNDAATGKPTPVRIGFRDQAGAFYAPLGRLGAADVGPGWLAEGQVALGTERLHHIDGACEVPLPPGPLHVTLARGPEYVPVSIPVTLAPGQLALRLTVQRWIDLRPQGWYAGDTRATGLTPQAALLEGEAEGLAVVSLLVRDIPAGADGPRRLTGVTAFSGTRPAALTEGCQVAVNTLNEHPVLGRVALLNSHRAVYPLRFGEPDEPDGWSVADWCDQCHRKKGLVVWPHLPRLTREAPQGEALAALLLGKIDAFEVSSFDEEEPESLAPWYQLLDCGLRPTLVGGSGKDSSGQVLGSVRTYARLAPGEAFSLSGWIEAVRAGRTFVTNGPLLFLTVDDEGPGTVLSAAEGRRVRLRLEAKGATAFDHMEILVNGEIAASRGTSGDRQAGLLETELTVRESSWIAARCWSEARLPLAGRQCVYAHTSPVYVAVEGKPRRARAREAQGLAAVLEWTREWVRDRARCETEKQRAHLLEILEQGAAALRARTKEE